MDRKSQILEDLRNFFESLAKDDVVAVLHHTDADGVCSGVIIAKVVERKRGKRIDFHFNQAATEIAVLDKTVGILKENKVNKVIMTDLGVDQSPSNVKEIEKFAEIVVIDHHKVYNDISSKKTIFIKPHFVSEKNPAAYTAAKLCFDLGSEIADISGMDWVAAVGLIGDCAFTLWKDFLDSVFLKYKIEKKQDIFDTKLGKVSTIISDAECFDSANASKAFDIIYNASNPDDVLDSELKKYREAVENEKAYWLEHVNEFAEFVGDTILYMIKPKYQIKPSLSTHLSLEYPGKTIVVVQDMGEEVLDISARRRDEKIAVNELLENATKGLEGSNAGGHVPAAGGRIRKRDFQKFKENLFSLLKNG